MRTLDHQCPRCGSTDCRLSTRAPLRLLARLVRLRPIRCRSCRARFWRFTPATGDRVRVPAGKPSR